MLYRQAINIGGGVQMKFPADFYQQIKLLYPGNEEVLAAVKEGDIRKVGDFLEKEDRVISAPEYIIGMLDAGGFVKLRVEMVRLARQRSLYNRWCELVADHYYAPVGG